MARAGASAADMFASLDAAQIMVAAAPPFNILHASPAWCALTGYTAEAVIGRPISLLHGPLTCRETLGALGMAMSIGRALRVMLVSYSSKGEPFLNCVDSQPVLDASGHASLFQWDVKIQSSMGDALPASSIEEIYEDPSHLMAASRLEDRGGALARSAAAPGTSRLSDLGSEISSLSNLSSSPEQDAPSQIDSHTAPTKSSVQTGQPQGEVQSTCSVDFQQPHMEAPSSSIAQKSADPVGMTPAANPRFGAPFEISDMFAPMSDLSQAHMRMNSVMPVNHTTMSHRMHAIPTPWHTAGLGGDSKAMSVGCEANGRNSMSVNSLAANSLGALAVGAPPLSLANAVAQALAIPGESSNAGRGRPFADPLDGRNAPTSKPVTSSAMPATVDTGFMASLLPGFTGAVPPTAATTAVAEEPHKGNISPNAAIWPAMQGSVSAGTLPQTVDGRSTGPYFPFSSDPLNVLGYVNGSPMSCCSLGTVMDGSYLGAEAPPQDFHATGFARGKRLSSEIASDDGMSATSGGRKRAKKSQEPRPAPFVQKLYEMVCSRMTDAAICWSESGRSFWIRRPDLMQSIILPQYFKHNRLVFFAKQLRAYGFRQRMASSCLDVVREWYHQHGKFYDGSTDLLPYIQRSCNSSTASSAPAAAPGASGSSRVGGAEALCKLEVSSAGSRQAASNSRGDSGSNGTSGTSYGSSGGSGSGGAESSGGSGGGSNSSDLSNLDSDSNAGSDSGGHDSNGKESADSSGKGSGSKLSATGSANSSECSSSGNRSNTTTAQAPSEPSAIEETTSGSGDGSDPASSRSVSPSTLQDQVAALNTRVELNRAALSEQRALILERIDGIVSTLRAKGLTSSRDCSSSGRESLAVSGCQADDASPKAIPSTSDTQTASNTQAAFTTGNLRPDTCRPVPLSTNTPGTSSEGAEGADREAASSNHMENSRGSDASTRTSTDYEDSGLMGCGENKSMVASSAVPPDAPASNATIDSSEADSVAAGEADSTCISQAGDTSGPVPTIVSAQDCASTHHEDAPAAATASATEPSSNACGEESKAG